MQHPLYGLYIIRIIDQITLIDGGKNGRYCIGVGK